MIKNINFADIYKKIPLSEDELCNILNIKKSILNKWISGDSLPSNYYLNRIYEMFPKIKVNKKNKYRNRKITINGITFDSLKEANRYNELKILEKKGLITDLKMQMSFILIPKQEGEREVKYIADFVYKTNGEIVVEDTKGFRTKEYIIKRKLMLYVHGIKIKEI